MNYQELSLSAHAAQAEALSEALESLGALSVSLQDANDIPIYEPKPQTHPLWDDIIITALFAHDADFSMIKAAITSHHNGIIINEALVEDQNWVEKSLNDFKPIAISKNLWICPSWHELEVDATILHLNPGLAFGTGEHPTTQMILRYLAEHPPHHTVVDFGCGSGILAITASLFGAEQVYAIDIDEQALVATYSNAQLNHKEKHITICLPEDLPLLQADQLLANIFLTPLIELRENFLRLLKAQGEILISGVLQSQVHQLMNAYINDFDLSVIDEQSEWLLVRGIKK